MATKDEITDIIFSAIDDIDLKLPEDQQQKKSFDTALLENMDSLDIINFITALEHRINEKFGRIINFIDEEIIHEEGPFKTIGSLAEYMSSLLQKD